MKKTLFLIVISSSLFAFYDFGTAGPLYDVKEKNIIKELKKQLVLKKDEIKKMATDAIDAGLIYKTNLPYSKEDKTIKTEPAIYIRHYNDGYRKYLLSNDKVHHIDDTMCFVKFESFDILDAIIKRYGKNCKYVFFDVDIRKISQNEKYQDIPVYLGSEKIIKMFKVKSTPMKLHIKKDGFTREYINYRQLKEDVKNEKQKKL